MSSKMGKDWIKKHKKEKFYKQAQEEGMRSRAAYKLRQIQKKFQILNNANQILDLCCAPGSWVEEIKQQSNEISIVGVDIVKMSPIEGVIFVQGDIRDESIINKLEKNLVKDVDVILGDCAPKFTGSKETDYARQNFLVERVLLITSHFLKKRGHLVCKLFDGDHTKKLREQLSQKFEKIHLFKPEASRKTSPEVYIVGKYYKKAS
ncbi:MAG: RlmE family RNA methyltransferase [Candidatus Helarchaeota archaeon]|nr:RlmE family RNA methyltransferase [Candidatus Helarchaeota archaeon]